MRTALADQCLRVQSFFQDELQNLDLPVVARATVETEALAKSHRPDTLFSANTCPIIGTDNIGTLLLSVTNVGLNRLVKTIQSGTTTDQIADISTLVEIEPYTEDFKSETQSLPAGDVLKIKIFNHASSKLNDRIDAAFKDLVQSENTRDRPISIERIHYSSDLIVYRVTGVDEDAFAKVKRFVGTQSVGPLPQFGLRAQYLPVGETSDDCFPLPEPSVTYPLVGIIDSGTDPNNERLQAWVERRDTQDVPESDQDNRHGSFVAGLIANGKALNHENVEFPDCQAKVVDIVAVPKNSPLYEDDLLETIRRAVRAHRDVRVWNLSLAQVGNVCQDNRVSDFAMALDEIQSDQGVVFVNCAGNIDGGSARKWPAVPTSEYDRIYAPGDSSRALTVGSVAHIANAQSLAQPGEPSPFSRRGPGPAFAPKPEVCHYGGNCDASFGYAQTGVLSTVEGNARAEAIGTSFSTPLISTTLACLLDSTSDPMSINMAKALIVHSAALRSGKTTAAELKYRGFGVPGKVHDLFECEDWRATLVFEPEIPVDRRVFSKLDFPVPDCFRTENGLLKGGFLLTAVYDPPLSTNGGFDYCQANVEVSLGSFDSKDADSDPEHQRIVPIHPKDYSKLGERSLVEHGFKWSPVKVFQHEFREKAVERIRLYVRLYLRSANVGIDTQNVAIVASMYDPKHELPVYNQTIQKLQQTGWQSVDLRLREEVRQRLR